MKKLLSTLIVIFSLSNLNAGLLWDFYSGVTVSKGKTIITRKNDFNKKSNSMSYGGVFGVEIPIFRLEAEYNNLDINNSNLGIGFLNAYLKMSLPIIKPYVGVGYGKVLYNKNRNFLNNKSVYQGMIGATLDTPVIPFNVDFELRGFDAPFYDYNNIINKKMHFVNYDLRLKARYVF